MIYIFGAICPKEGKAAGLVLPRCNTEAMALHLTAISETVAPGRHAALLVDRAGWHSSVKLAVPGNLTLVPLPASGSGGPGAAPPVRPARARVRARQTAARVPVRTVGRGTRRSRDRLAVLCYSAVDDWGARMGAVRKAGSDVVERLTLAETACAARGARLTPNRRDVLAIILEAEGPITAYALLDRLKQSHPGAVPPTVYRALDFLIEQGLVHKIERLNAYVGCVEGAAHGHDHPMQFLICRDCGGVTEVEDDEVAEALAHAAKRTGFAPTHAIVEVEGTCGDCAARE